MRDIGFGVQNMGYRIEYMGFSPAAGPVAVRATPRHGVLAVTAAVLGRRGRAGSQMRSKKEHSTGHPTLP